MSEIIFNGKSSRDFFLHIESDMTYNSPSRKSELVSVPGVDGELDIGDGTLSNGKKSYAFVISIPDDVEKEELFTSISNWLKQDNGWHELEDRDEPDYIYTAKYVEEYDVQSLVRNYGRFTITFTVKPYKFLRSGLAPLDNPASLFNQTVRNARPKITIKGTGNITLKIGSEELKLKNVEDGVIIDSLYQTATDLAGNKSVWDKVLTYPLPVIKPGNQDITITGGTFSIVPRFEVIV